MRLYLNKRHLHFTSGFFVRNSGEIGVFLFTIVLFLLVCMIVKDGIDKWVPSIGVVVGAFGAYAAFLTQQRGKMHEIIHSLDDDFEKLTKQRAKFGKTLQAMGALQWPRIDDGADEILDFFETVSFLVRSGALSLTLVDEAFSFWAIRYWLICCRRIDELRSEDVLIYASLEWLYDNLEDIGNTDEEALKKFIKYEAEMK